MLKNVYSCFYISSSGAVFFLKVPRNEVAAPYCSIVDIRSLYVITGCNYNWNPRNTPRDLPLLVEYSSESERLWITAAAKLKYQIDGCNRTASENSFLLQQMCMYTAFYEICRCCESINWSFDQWNQFYGWKDSRSDSWTNNGKIVFWISPMECWYVSINRRDCLV